MKLNRVVATLVAFALAAVFASAPALAAGKPVPTSKVNINTAAAQQLTTLPGIGPKLAARIVEYRQHAGPFRTAQELHNVKGVGEKKFQKLQPHILVGEAPARAATAK
jgi:competence protein ComEA